MDYKNYNSFSEILASVHECVLPPCIYVYARVCLGRLQPTHNSHSSKYKHNIKIANRYMSTLAKPPTKEEAALQAAKAKAQATK